jgi:hypothetical protein
MEDLKQDVKVTQGKPDNLSIFLLLFYSFCAELIFQILKMVTLPTRGSLTTDESREKLKVSLWLLIKMSHGHSK